MKKLTLLIIFVACVTFGSALPFNRFPNLNPMVWRNTVKFKNFRGEKSKYLSHSRTANTHSKDARADLSTTCSHGLANRNGTELQVRLVFLEKLFIINIACFTILFYISVRFTIQTVVCLFRKQYNSHRVCQTKHVSVGTT